MACTSSHTTSCSQAPDIRLSTRSSKRPPDEAAASWTSKTSDSPGSSPTGPTWRSGSGEIDLELGLAAERALVGGPAQKERWRCVGHAEADVEWSECLALRSELVARPRGA